MDLTELARLGRRMREKQSEYFKTRNNTVLAERRDLERRFDAAVQDVLSPPQPGLFDAPKIKEAE